MNIKPDHTKAIITTFTIFPQFQMYFRFRHIVSLFSYRRNIIEKVSLCLFDNSFHGIFAKLTALTRFTYCVKISVTNFIGDNMSDSNKTGLIFDIQRFSVHDGPGIRTTVFFKGCPLRCKWCHNPEGLEHRSSLRYIAEKCISCKKCADICPQSVHIFKESHEVDFSRCTVCKTCVSSCPAEAVDICGYMITAEELAKEVEADKVFYGKEGGVTFSGGEVLLQSEFALLAIQKIRETGAAPTIAIDTSGYASHEAFIRLSDVADIFLYDVKAVSDNIHFPATGVHNKIILENLQYLAKTNKRIWIRIPVIPTINDSGAEQKKIAEFLAALPNKPERVTLMPYHLLGKNKYQTIGMKNTFEVSPENNRIQDIISFYTDLGLEIKN